MSNPKKIYLSPPYPYNREKKRDWASNQVDGDWVEYVSTDEIKNIIEMIDNECSNFECNTIPIC